VGRLIASGLLAASLGCGWHQHGLSGHHALDMAGLQNPLFVQTADHELLWNQVVDTVDNYFKIQKEERVRLVGDVVLEGRIDTFPADGSTLLEPWRDDSTPGFEKLHATLQSVRRQANVRVIPAQGGYLIDVAVYKEVEDLEQPQHAAVGRARVRHGDSLAPSQPDALDELTLGWIRLGRDVSLEQQILTEIRQRLAEVPASAAVTAF
jgi:hypothetical protein